ncbi:MAG: hypothetical protein HY209_00720 [Candidatus Omnitrophica bacterium]|nr:hypothetical protein [Candidatus Omnitrophota bacterium]
MTVISVREFSHHMAKYLKKLRSGQGFVLKYRNQPIAQVTPNYIPSTGVVPSWKRPFKRIKVKGEPVSQTISRMRHEDWR